MLRPALCLLMLCLTPTVEAQLFGEKAVGPLTGAALSARKHMKNSGNLSKQGQYYMASCSILDALALKPKPKYSKKLMPISERGYAEKLQLAEASLQSENFEEALHHFEHLSSYLNALRELNMLNFATININKAAEQASLGVAADAYRTAEGAFMGGDYMDAINFYRKALDHSNDFKDSHLKIAESFYRVARQEVENKTYRQAAESFLKSHNEVPNYLDSAEQGMEIYYQLGAYFSEKGLHRKAWTEFKNVEEVSFTYRDVADRVASSMEAAKVVIGFGSFENRTYENVGGIAVGDFIFQELKQKLNAGKSPFLSFSPDPGSATIVASGNVTQVTVNEQGPTSINKSQVMKWEDTIKNDGKKIKVPRQETVYYVEKSWSRDVIFAGNMSLLNKNTRETVFTEQIQRSLSDSVHWAEVTSNSENNRHMPLELQALVRGRKQLQSKDQMIKEVVGQITNELAQKILQQIDSVQSSSDPLVLSLDPQKSS